jgi:hypothetical protein
MSLRWLSLRRKQAPRRHVPSSTCAGPLPSSDLWDHIIDMHWETVIQHCQDFPQDAAFEDGHYHETPLYLALQFNPPIEAIRSILRAYPASVTLPCGENHDIPLHIACKNRATAEVLEVLVQEYPCTALRETKWGKIPLVTLWESHKEADNQFWEKANILLRAVDRHRRASADSFRKSNLEVDQPSLPPVEQADHEHLLHAAVSLGSLGCPFEILEHVVERYPHQWNTKDRLGQNPLHIIVGPTSWSRTSRRKYKPRENDIITLLLEKCPDAAIEPLATDNGRYPLHISLLNRHTWDGGVKKVFYAAPSVLLVTDPVTNLYPFQLAAIPVRDTPVDLDTIFHLLRQEPAVLSRFNFSRVEEDITHCYENGASSLLGVISARIQEIAAKFYNSSSSSSCGKEKQTTQRTILPNDESSK